jgi:hypothetical protein
MSKPILGALVSDRSGLPVPASLQSALASQSLLDVKPAMCPRDGLAETSQSRTYTCMHGGRNALAANGLDGGATWSRRHAVSFFGRVVDLHETWSLPLAATGILRVFILL